MIKLNGKYATIKEAILLSGRSRTLVYKAITNKKIDFIRIERTIIIPESEIEKLRDIKLNRFEYLTTIKDKKK